MARVLLAEWKLLRHRHLVEKYMNLVEKYINTVEKNTNTAKKYTNTAEVSTANWLSGEIRSFSHHRPNKESNLEQPLSPQAGEY